MYKWSYKMPKEQGRDNLTLICVAESKRAAYFSFCAMCRANYWPESIIKESKIKNVSF